METFSHMKNQALSKLDKSSVGNIDERIKTLCTLINTTDNYYTLSSCSGRICLLKTQNHNKKNATWPYVTHEKASLQEIWEVLKIEKGHIQFKQEPVILHIAAKTLSDAKKFIIKAQQCGFNKCHLLSFDSKIVVECCSGIPLSLPVLDEEILITQEYLSYLINTANKLQEKSWSTIEKLESHFNL